MDNKEVFAECVKQRGVDAQVSMCIEEMAELTKALLKLKRQEYRWVDGDEHWNSITEEVADVELMLEQVKDMFNITGVEEMKAYKMGKLLGLLGGIDD